MRQDFVDHKPILNTVVRHSDNDPGRVVFIGPPQALQILVKIGTYLKALAAKDNNVPFYVALPSPTIDWRVNDGLSEIPIEERNGSEVSHIADRGAGSTSLTGDTGIH